MTSNAPTARHVLLRCGVLTLLCIGVYFFGLTSHGLTNWQEAVRASVAREMHQKNEWFVPTRGGQPYLAKPPMIYWAQRGVAILRGDRAFTNEFEVRFVVATFGLLGVLTTYLVGRQLLRRNEDDDPASHVSADRAAFWGALTLAVGILTTRSARVGELDILLVPFVVVGIGALVVAWRGWLRDRRTRWGAIILGTLAACGATLTKGPPALLVIILGGIGSLLAWGAMEGMRTTPVRWRCPIIVGVLSGLGLALGGVLHYEESRDWIGVIGFFMMGVPTGIALALAMRPAAIRAWGPAILRTHPWFVLGIPVLAFVGWGRLVSQRIGAEEVARLAQAELDDNLRMLVPGSIINNAGFFIYALAPLAIVAMLLAIVMWRRRGTLMTSSRVNVLVPIVWAALGFVAFSTLGKGVARYLTPVWPAIALLTGIVIARWLAMLAEGNRRRACVMLWAIVLIAGAGQAWWYGIGRERVEPDRSPRAIAKVLNVAPEFTPSRIGTLDFEEPGLDWYVGDRAEQWRARKPDSMGKLREIVAKSDSPYTLLVRRQSPRIIERFGDAERLLADAGMKKVGTIDVEGLYSQPPSRTPIEVWLIRPISSSVD